MGGYGARSWHRGDIEKRAREKANTLRKFLTLSLPVNACVPFTISHVDRISKTRDEYETTPFHFFCRFNKHVILLPTIHDIVLEDALWTLTDWYALPFSHHASCPVSAWFSLVC